MDTAKTLLSQLILDHKDTVYFRINMINLLKIAAITLLGLLSFLNLSASFIRRWNSEQCEMERKKVAG